MVWVPAIQFTLSSGAQQPSRSYPGDAGYDLYVSQDTLVLGGDTKDIPTGLRISLPEGVWVHMVGRSSTIRNYGLLVIPAVIDNGYRGELYFNVYNTTSEPVYARKGQRLAQIIPHQILNFRWKGVSELDESERNTKGFGSSGE